ncbi:MAG: hypothetical protein KBT28_03290 [Bacteroidales bacterium]|nr:hypothetical protein [Candidatus Colimorpha merdihippi]
MKSCSNYPFGEEYVGQHIASPYTERFTFTGKERDEQTGYGYFGGRYFDAIWCARGSLWTRWVISLNL